MQYVIPDIALLGNTFALSSRAAGENTFILSNIQFVTTGGYYAPGDGGAAQFKRVAGPLNDGASFQSQDGAWWQIVSVDINVRQFGAKGDNATDDTEAFQNALDWSKEVFVQNGNYIVNGVVVAGEGYTILGESDYNTSLWATDSNPIFFFGNLANDISQFLTLKNMTIGGKASFNGECYIRVKRCFQTYFERIRYKGSLANPSEAIYVLDNNGGTSEQPIRTTFRDCYIDGVNYSDGLTHARIGIWCTGGIQTQVENTHIQDCEIGCKLGVNPLVDTQYYNPAFPNDHDFYDFYFTNNSRYQVGDRGGTDTEARAFDVWWGSGVNVSDSQIYLNNNRPNPPLADQCVAVFNSLADVGFGIFTMSNCVVNGNSRSTNAFRVAPGAAVDRLAVYACEFGGMASGNPLVKVEAGGICNTVIDGNCVWDNPNNYGPVSQQTNTLIGDFDLGLANNYYYIRTSGSNITINDFINGSIGVNYIIQFEITGGGSAVTLNAAAPGSFAGFVVDGFAAGNISLRNGDMLIVMRAPLAAADYYLCKLIRGGVLTTPALFLPATALPAGAVDGTLVIDSADNLLKLRKGGVWVSINTTP